MDVVSTYLAQYGIQATSLTQAQRDKLAEVLRAGGSAAIQELTRILTQEASKYTAPAAAAADQAAQQKAAQAAIDAATQAQADQDKKRRMWLVVGSIAGGLILLTVGLLLVVRHKRKRHGR